MSGLVLLLIILFCIFINNFLHYWITRAEMVFNRFWYALKCILNWFFLSCFFVVFSCVIFYCFILYCYYHFVLFCIVISILLNLYCYCHFVLLVGVRQRSALAMQHNGEWPWIKRAFQATRTNILRIFQEIF